MPSPVRFDTVFDDALPAALTGPVRITSGADARLQLDHGWTRGIKAFARARTARTLLGLAATTDARLTVRLELRWDTTTDEWCKPNAGLAKLKARLIPWVVAGFGAPAMEIKRGKPAAAEVTVPAGSIPPGGLLLVEVGATPPAQSATGLVIASLTLTPS